MYLFTDVRNGYLQIPVPRYPIYNQHSIQATTAHLESTGRLDRLETAIAMPNPFPKIDSGPP